MLTHATDANEWNIHVEANTTPHTQGVSGLLPEANADAGSALDQDRRGRIQLSQLNFRHTFNPRQAFTTGLLDVSSHFDQSRIASDETTQFLGVAFTGNPAIEFPDYTLGLVYEHALTAGPTLRIGIASSNGLADNPKHSYSQLVNLDANEKGLFAITSATWKNPAWLLRSGVWTHTADHDLLDGTGGGRRNYGAYLLAGRQAGQHAFNLRMGIANQNVTQAAGFAGLSYRYLHKPFELGVGTARIFLSSQTSNPALQRHQPI